MLQLEDVAKEMREKFPGRGVFADHVCDCLLVSAHGPASQWSHDFTIRRREIDDNLHMVKCERMLKALEEPYPPLRAAGR